MSAPFDVFAPNSSPPSASIAAALGDQTRWYAVQCQPHRERYAAMHLGKQNFSAFLPFLKKTRRHARKIETVLAPFLPGYLFVALDVTRQRWRSVNGTYGVVRLVMQGDQPAPVPHGLVEALQDASGDADVVPWQAELKQGQAVRILTGPLAGFLGEFDALTDAGRVRVLLGIMGGHTPVYLPRESVVSADSVL